jgi:hypothetical protein
MSEKISHAATMVVIRKGKNPGEIEMIAFVYTKHRPGRQPFSSWKFPTEGGEPGETRWMTAANGVVRELCETPDNPEGFDIQALGPRDAAGEPLPSLVSRVPGDADKEAEWHDKCVFVMKLSPESLSRLRKQPKWEKGDELLGVPEFVEAGELWQRMLERGQPFHRAVLFRVLKHLARQFEPVQRRYGEILRNPHSQQAMMGRGNCPIQFMD